MISDYNSLSIKDYDRISVISSDSSLDDKMKDVNILSVLNSCSTQDILNLSPDKVDSLLNKAKFLLSRPSYPSLPKELSYDGYKFSLKNLSNYCYGQQLDYSSFHGPFTDLLHIILVPTNHSYNDGSYNVDFGNLPTPIALSIIQSFLKGLVKSATRSLKYSRVLARLTHKPQAAGSLKIMEESILQLPLPL